MSSNENSYFCYENVRDQKALKVLWGLKVKFTISPSIVWYLECFKAVEMEFLMTINVSKIKS